MDGRKRIGFSNYFELPQQFVVCKWLNTNLWPWSDEYSISVLNCAICLWFSDILECFSKQYLELHFCCKLSSLHLYTCKLWIITYVTSYFSAIWIEVEYIRKKIWSYHITLEYRLVLESLSRILPSEISIKELVLK